MFLVEPAVHFNWITPNAAKEIEMAGRVCYKSEDQATDNTTAGFIRRRMSTKHFAVIEHACASFRIICDRGITHEIVRHRLASYCQESTRYVTYNSGLGVIMPIVLRNMMLEDEYQALIKYTNKFPVGLDSREHSSNLQQLSFSFPDYICEWVRSICQAEAGYRNMLDHNFAPQVARSLLPTCTKTEIVMTCNFREWLTVIGLRTAKGAHPDMIHIMKQVEAKLKELCPEVFDNAA